MGGGVCLNNDAQNRFRGRKHLGVRRAGLEPHYAILNGQLSGSVAFDVLQPDHMARVDLGFRLLGESADSGAE